MSRRRGWLLLAGIIMVCAGGVVAWPRLEAEYYYVGVIRATSADAYVTNLFRLEHFRRPQAIPPLLRLLRNDKPLVRDNAARALEHYPTDAVIDALMAVAARDPDVQPRIAAVTILGEIGDARAIGLLQDYERRNVTESDYARDALRRFAARGVTR